MKKISRRTFLAATGLAAVSALTACGGSSSSSAAAGGASSAAQASTWPNGDVTCYVPAKAGGGTDMLARLFTGCMNKKTGANFVVINDDTGGGTVAAETVFNAKPEDQYWLLSTSAMSSKVSAGQYKRKLTDFTVVGVFSTPGTESGVILVGKDSPFQTLEELIDYAKANPGDLVNGVANGGSTMFSTALFQESTGIETTLVDAGSDVDKITGLMGGNLDLALTSIPSAAQYVASGDVRALVVTGNTPSKLITGVPTMQECGYESCDLPMFGVLLACPGVPQADIDRVNEFLAEACADETLQADYTKMGFDWAYWTQEETIAALEDAQEKYDLAYQLVSQMNLA